jgi:hypothetical protein
MIYTQVVPASHLTPACHPPCPPRSWPFPRTTQWPWPGQPPSKAFPPPCISTRAVPVSISGPPTGLTGRDYRGSSKATTTRRQSRAVPRSVDSSWRPGPWGLCHAAPCGRHGSGRRPGRWCLSVPRLRRKCRGSGPRRRPRPPSPFQLRSKPGVPAHSSPCRGHYSERSSLLLGTLPPITSCPWGSYIISIIYLFNTPPITSYPHSPGERLYLPPALLEDPHPLGLSMADACLAVSCLSLCSERQMGSSHSLLQ